MTSSSGRESLKDYLLLCLPPLFWAGNMVIGRAMRNDMPPVAMTFWRWSIAALVLLPFVWREIAAHKAEILRAWKLFAVFGVINIAFFNTMCYVGLRYTTATRTPRARAPKLCPQCPACHLSAKASVCHGSTGVVVLPPLHMAMYNFSNTLSARDTRTLCVTTAFKLITARGDGSSCGSCGAFRQTGAAALVLAVSRAAGP